MNRFKFRIWDVELKAYRTTKNSSGACLYIDSEEGMATCGDGCEVYGIDEGTVLEQCTGTKDKNNNLIYEGDIILYNNVKYIVKWSDIECRWYFDIIDENNSNVEYLEVEISKNIEVIGNIHNETVI